MALPILIFDGDKGGVGKSTACGGFVDWALKQGLSVAVVDGDSRNPDVHRIFDVAIPVALANLRVHDGFMDLNDFIATHEDKIVVVSMPAGVGAEMKKEAPRLISMAETYDRKIALAWVMNRTLDSINLLNEAMKAYGPKLGHMIAIKNLFFGTEDKFHRWDNSETKKKFEKAGGLTVALHELHERVMDKLFADEQNIIPYSSASVAPKDHANSPHKLTPSEATELRIWLSDNAAVFAAIAKHIGVKADASN